MKIYLIYGYILTYVSGLRPVLLWVPYQSAVIKSCILIFLEWGQSKFIGQLRKHGFQLLIIKGKVLSLFLPVQAMQGQCIYNMTMLCQSVIIILSNLQNSYMVKLPHLHVICGLISSFLSADQLRKLFIMNKNRCN